MSEEQYEFDLHWHALNYRTAASQHAHTYWFDLESCVKRIVDKAVKDSAAPDLLEALEILLAVVDEVANSRGWPDNTPRHKARAAIAKAKNGEQQ